MILNFFYNIATVNEANASFRTATIFGQWTSTKFLMPCSIFDSFFSVKKFRRLRQFQCGAALLLVHCSLDQKLLLVIGIMVLNSKFWLVPRLFSLSLLDLNYCLGSFSWLENICHKQLLHPNSCFICDYNLFTQLLIS